MAIETDHRGMPTVASLERRRRERAERQRDELLEAIEAHRGLWEGARPVRNPLLAAVREQDDALYETADRIHQLQESHG